MNAVGTPAITAIVPARNEEQAIETSVRSLAAQPEIAEIRVVNDGSSDRTAEILARLAAEISQLRVIEAGALPSGWVGKNHAAWLGAQDATTDWLLFTDADVAHIPGSARRALRTAAETGAALLSYSPHQILENWWERALIPFIFVRLAVHFSYDAVKDSQKPIAAANGQYLLVRRMAYQTLGGHHAVSGEVLEDLALATLAKVAGYQLYFAAGPEIARTRMYRTFADMWQGWTKNIYVLTGGSTLGLAAELIRILPWELALFFPSFYGLTFLQQDLWMYGAALCLGRVVEYGKRLLRHQFPLRYIIWWGPGLVLYVAALVASASHYASGSVAWKGRTYPVRP